MKTFDYIICGSGCAGILLAHTISRSKKLADKRILLIDSKENPCQNISFGSWINLPDGFDLIALAAWDMINIESRNAHISLGKPDYHYRLIKGHTLYQSICNELENNSNVTILNSKIISIADNAESAIIKTDKGSFTAKFVFNSLTPDYKKIEQNKDYITLWQHFKAWEIETESDSFKVSTATLMDFRVKQDNICRFAHVLPYSSRKAFVEIVSFEPTLYKPTDFEIYLKKYIKEVLKIEEYKITYTEAGIIPMTEYPFRKKESDHVFNIGTRGGTVKPSTGYSFKRIINDINKIVNLLENNRTPYIKNNLLHQRFKLYDRTLLDVLYNNRIEGSELFSGLFSKNKPESILKFLDEGTNILEELTIFSRVRIIPFVKAIFASLIRPLKRYFASKPFLSIGLLRMGQNISKSKINPSFQ